MLKSKNQILIISSISLIIIGIITFLINYEIATMLFYLVPIFLFSYQDKIALKYVIFFSIIAGLQWFLIEFITYPYSKDIYLFWNSISRFVVFLLIAVVLKRIIIEKEQRKVIIEQTLHLEEINKTLHSTNDELNKFIGMAAHDIRNPISTILGFSDLLISDDKLFTEHKEIATYINKLAINSLQILNDTLNISKIQSGTLNLNITKNDYVVFVNDCILINKQLAVAKNQNIKFNSPLDSLVIEFDKSRLLQLLNNLLTNAIKYSDFNTEIIVNIKLIPDKPDVLLTEIIDSGIGIEEEFRHKIFEPFATTSNVPTNNESKTGLGLAIAKKIVELHGGEIYFTSAKGKGSTFYFTIPIIQQI